MPSCRQIARTRPGPISAWRGTVVARAPSELRHFVCFAPSATRAVCTAASLLGGAAGRLAPDLETGPV